MRVVGAMVPDTGGLDDAGLVNIGGSVSPLAAWSPAPSF